MPTRQIALLRGINLGPRNRIAMPELRSELTDAGFEGVRTYVQSGNIVLDGDATPAQLEQQIAEIISRAFGLDIPVVVRTREELARVVKLNPLEEVATNPKRYQVSFLSGELDPDTVEKLQAAAAPSERFVAHGREAYAWHPAGVARSKLWTSLAGKGLGVTATSRNWTTVTALLEMADA
jgi:uncharacterized protein (DUF1697 family)